MTQSNGTKGASSASPETLNRAQEVSDLIDAVKSLAIPFIGAADEAAATKSWGGVPATNGSNGSNVSNGSNGSNGHAPTRTSLVETKTPQELVQALKFSLPEGEGQGKEGLLRVMQDVLRYSVNTWDQGFMDKLYSSTNAVGVASELLLSILNTNLHVFQVSPALTVIEKASGRALARRFGFDGPRAGGLTMSGGSASNLTSIVIARNTLYPESKAEGNAPHQFILFTSAHGHYSVKKAAQICGIGSNNAWSVPVDSEGRMIPSKLRELVLKAKAEGKTPLYVNATAGTTVMGSFDPFEEISDVCKEFNLWMHIDGSWGGPAIFSAQQRHKLRGSHLADTITMNPHKMMNVPVSCSFLLGRDMSIFHKANTLPAGYLFHNDDAESEEVWDLADLTLQCGRKGDSLKLALSWIFHGAAGFERQIDHAFDMAAYLATLVQKKDNFVLVSTNPPPCLQVCFYYAPGGRLSDSNEGNTARTRDMVHKLISRGFMVDFSPGERGSFFRVVVNWQTLRGTVEGLVRAIEEIGKEMES